jgi:hypothetical protein
MANSTDCGRDIAPAAVVQPPLTANDRSKLLSVRQTKIAGLIAIEKTLPWRRTCRTPSPSTVGNTVNLISSNPPIDTGPFTQP